MLAIDLDDTLLHTDKTISAFSEDVLKRAGKADIKVVFASARPIRTIKHLLRQVSCDAVICHNGAVILSGGKRIDSGYGVPIAKARYILQTLQSRHPDKKLSVEINDRIYANFDVTEFWGKTPSEKAILQASAVRSDFSDLPTMNADKVLVEIRSEKEYNETLSLLSDDLYGQPSDGGSLCMIINRAATKLNAIKMLAGLWSVSMAEIAAFGDDYNDIEMLTCCGVGVAMGNAIPEVLHAADVVTGINNDDGVAKYILKCILPR